MIDVNIFPKNSTKLLKDEYTFALTSGGLAVILEKLSIWIEDEPFSYCLYTNYLAPLCKFAVAILPM